MSHPNKVSVIFKKKDKEDTTGYLRLSYRQDNKTKLISIKMLPAIPENYWNAKKERIKSGFNNYQELNQIIEKSKLDFLNQKEQKPDEKNKIKFIDYSINIIDKQYVKISTKKKFLSSLRFFQRFLKETILVEDILISELNQNLFQNFYNYIIQNKIKANSTSQYISTLKMLLLKIEKIEDLDFLSGLSRKIPSPKKEERKKRVITIEDFKKILSTKIEDNTLEQTRLIFLFSSFTNGMRYSDVATVRLKNLVITNSNDKYEIRIKKLQKKTLSKINNLINYQGMMIIAHFLKKDLLAPDDKIKVENYLKILSLYNIETSKEKYNEDTKISINVKLDNEILTRHYHKNPISISLNEVGILKNNYTKNKIMEYNQQKLDDISIDVAISENEHLVYLDNLAKYIQKEIEKERTNKFNQLQTMQLDFYKLLCKILTIYKLKNPNDFIFPLIKEEDFSDISEDIGFANPSKEQFDKLKNSIVKYNRNLNKIAKILEIPNFTSHSARSSYASLIIALKGSEKVNPYDLMKTMGHSQIKQTIDYVNELNTDGADELTKLLSDRLSGG